MSESYYTRYTYETAYFVPHANVRHCNSVAKLLHLCAVLHPLGCATSLASELSARLRQPLSAVGPTNMAIAQAEAHQT